MSLREEMAYLDEAIHFGKDNPLYLLFTLSTLTSSALVTLLVAGISNKEQLREGAYFGSHFGGRDLLEKVGQ